LDCHGRVVDRRLFAALGWQAGTRLSIREDGGLVLIAADPRGVFCVTPQGDVRVPVAVRRWCALAPGDRVLLAADPEEGVLVVHPPAALDAMVRQAHLAAFGGEPS
jgi:hypothetical protein